MDTIETFFALMVFIFYNCVMRLTSKSNKLTAWSSIQMLADKTAELNISGFIGVPEWWQFDPDMEKDVISTKEKMQSELKEIANLKVETIKVNIDSLGGDVNHGQAMFSALSKNPANIEVEYTGWSASIATIIAAAATDNNISMSATNMILIHEARGLEWGTASTIRAYAGWLDKINDTMSDVYAKQSGNTKEDMRAVMAINNGEGEWLTATEAQDKGLIKYVNNELSAAANYDLTRLSKFGYKIPQNKLNNLNMALFNKKQPINTLAMKDGSAFLHEGELKKGSEMQKAGELIDLKGDHEAADGRTIIIGDENKVTEIKAKVEADPKTANSEEVVDQVAQILVDFEAKIDAKLEALKTTGSNTKVPKVDEPKKVIETSQASASIGIQGRMKEIAAQKRKDQGLN